VLDACKTCGGSVANILECSPLASVNGAVIGSFVGGCLAISIMVFVFWLRRKRAQILVSKPSTPTEIIDSSLQPPSHPVSASIQILVSKPSTPTEIIDSSLQPPSHPVSASITVHPSSPPLSITLSHDEVMHNQCINRWVTKHVETVSFVLSFYNVSSRNHITLNTECHRFEATGSVAGSIPFSRSPPIFGSITKFGMNAFDQELISRPKLLESSSTYAMGLQQLAALAERRLDAAKTAQSKVQLLSSCPRSPSQSQNLSTVFMPQ
jgi:hypothetical protein